MEGRGGGWTKKERDDRYMIRGIERDEIERRNENGRKDGAGEEKVKQKGRVG